MSTIDKDPVSMGAMGALAPMDFWESHECTKKTWHSTATDYGRGQWKQPFCPFVKPKADFLEGILQA